jgi:hypothetical protein
VKVNCSFTNWIRTPRPVQVLHQTAIVEVTGQPIHAVHHDRVTLTDERQQRLQLRPMHVLARRQVDERAVHLEVLKLPVRVLIETAHPQVTDPLPSHPPTPECQVEICDPRGQHVNQYGTWSNLTRPPGSA